MEAHPQYGSAIVTVRRDGVASIARYPVYRIDNDSDDAIVVRQANAAAANDATRRPVFVQPGASCVFGWDEPNHPKRLLELRAAGHQQVCCVHRLLL